MKNLFLLLTMLVITCPTFTQTRNIKVVKTPTESPTNEKRKAVVIGMSDYGAGRSLDYTQNDANDMADVFALLGFEVTLLKNNDLRNLNANLTDWYKSIEGNDMAVFYFSGHGIEVDGQSYLIPVDAELNSQADVKFASLSINQVLGSMIEKEVVVKMLILDVARDNPFSRGWNRSMGSDVKGLARMETPLGTYIAFAASLGSVAQDGGVYKLNNGVFTHFLKLEIVKKGITIDEIFNNVTGGVADMTRFQQIPFRYSSLSANYYFIPSNQ